MKKIGFLLLLVIMLSPCVMFAEGSRETKSPQSAEEAYPSKPVRLIVPYAAGGGTDRIARLIAQKLEEKIGQPVPIINIGGAGGGLGMQELKASPADGYTLGMDIVNILTRKILKTSTDGPEAFDVLAQCGTYYLAEVTRASSPYTTLKEVLDEAKRKPDTIQEATNIGAIIHFTSLALMDATGAKLRLVHMGDGAQRITSVLGGHVEITIMGTQEALPYYQSKEMKVLAVTSSKRLPGMEDVPTAVEQGINVVQPNDYWFFMPKGSPKDRVGFMTNALEQVMKDQEIISRMLSLSMEPSFMAGDELAKHIAEREEMLVEIAKKYNLVQ